MRNLLAEEFRKNGGGRVHISGALDFFAEFFLDLSCDREIMKESDYEKSPNNENTKSPLGVAG